MNVWQPMIDAIHSVICSEAYRDRLATIHKHYPNLKSEGRYRDALVELFNDEQENTGSGWRAYAEARKHDMVITRAGENEEGWLRIELKYHFVFDFAYRVKRSLAAYGEAPEVPAQRGDLGSIIHDCVHEKKSGHRSDLFILVVQDRFGAAQSAYAERRSGGTRRISYPAVHERGVPLHFLNEQIKLEHERPDTYDREWRIPLYDMLVAIHKQRRYRLRPAVTHTVPPALEVPLNSHVFMLDFTVHDTLLPDIGAVFPKLEF